MLHVANMSLLTKSTNIQGQCWDNNTSIYKNTIYNIVTDMIYNFTSLLLVSSFVADFHSFLQSDREVCL